MTTGNNCGDRFANGITQGYQWYPLYGGMQDFNYINRETFEITLELSCVKYPATNTLQGHWEDNKVSLMEYAKATLHGVSGEPSFDFFYLFFLLLFFSFLSSSSSPFDN